MGVDWACGSGAYLVEWLTGLRSCVRRDSVLFHARLLRGFRTQHGMLTTQL